LPAPAAVPAPVAAPSGRRSSPRAAAKGGRGRAEAQTEATPAEDDEIDFAEEGWMPLPSAEGSAKPTLHLLVKVDTGSMLACDIHIPPLSFNTREPLGPSKSMFLSVLKGEESSLILKMDDEDVLLSPGDHAIVRSGTEYSLRNDSATTAVIAKMVIIIHASDDAGANEGVGEHFEGEEEEEADEGAEEEEVEAEKEEEAEEEEQEAAPPAAARGRHSRRGARS